MEMYFGHVETKQKVTFVRQLSLIKLKVYSINKHWHA